MNYLNSKAKALQQGAIRALFDRASNMKDVISMGIGEPDMATPVIVREACKEALDKGITHYTPNAGLMMLREAVAEKSSVRNIGYDPATEIIITNGGMGALSLLFLVLLENGDEVLIQDPQWLNYVAQVSYCDGKAVRVPTDFAHNFEMQPDEIERRITKKTKAIMINSPNNPTGGIMSKETMEKIAQICKKYDLLAISDEVYNTLIYNGEEYMSIAELPGMKERTVVINSFSKSYAMTGWRIGYAAGPEYIIDRMVKCQENFNACANSIGQYAAAIALDHPECVGDLRSVFHSRQKILLEELSEIPGVRCNCLEGAFYAFPNIEAFGLSSAEFCDRLLEEAGVVCIPGSAFGGCGEGHIRIAYTCAENELREAMHRLKAFCKKL